MSWWADLRDAIEVVATGVLQYYYPGSGLVTGQLVSRGIQNTPEYGYMMGAAGLFGGMEGNFSNYGTTASALGETLGSLGSGSEAALGATGTSALGGSTGDYVQQLLNQGYSQEEALTMAQQAQAAQGATNATAGGIASPGQPAQPGIAGQPAFGQNAGVPGGSPFAAATPGMASTPMTANAAGVGAMPLGSPSSNMTLGTGLYGLAQSENLKRQGQLASQQADPFGPYRAQYAQQMAALSANPGLITQQPGYEAGLEAVRRSMAAGGYSGSGNMMAALSKYGGDFYNQTMQMYSGLAGAGINPGTGAQLNFAGQMAGTNLGLNSLGLLGKATSMAGS
jgi:hypothetical protein